MPETNPLEVLRQFNACPFCHAPKDETAACCGEVRNEMAYELHNGMVWLASEIKLTA